MKNSENEKDNHIITQYLSVNVGCSSSEAVLSSCGLKLCFMGLLRDNCVQYVPTLCYLSPECPNALHSSVIVRHMVRVCRRVDH